MPPNKFPTLRDTITKEALDAEVTKLEKAISYIKANLVGSWNRVRISNHEKDSIESLVAAYEKIVTEHLKPLSDEFLKNGIRSINIERAR